MRRRELRGRPAGRGLRREQLTRGCTIVPVSLYTGTGQRPGPVTHSAALGGWSSGFHILCEARAEAGAPAVVMGTNNVAQIQADQLLDDCVFSHWGTDGLKPYMRYSLAGGYQVNGENAYSLNECGLSDTLLQWNKQPMEMITAAVEGFLESPGHRETMLASSYSKVNIGLAWSRNTFKAIQHFEGDYVEITRTPTIQAGKLTLEGRLTSGNEFDSRYPIYALLVYDPKPQTLTSRATGQDLLLLIR